MTRRDSLRRSAPAILAFSLVSGAASAQAPDPVALLDALDAKRLGDPRAPLPETLVVAGDASLLLPGTDQPMKARIAFLFSGPNVRESTDYGPFGLYEIGDDGTTLWESHPVTGVRRHLGDDAAVWRRMFAMFHWTGWRSQFREAFVTGTDRVDGRPQWTLRMIPIEGEDERWWVDRETSLPTMKEVRIPWTDKDRVAIRVRYEEWKRVGGILYPSRYGITAGSATGTYRIDRIAPGEAIAPERFTMPEAVREMIAKEGQPAPNFQIVEGRAAQPAASIRLTIPRRDLFRTLASIYPEVMAYLTEIGADTAGTAFCRYHAEDAATIDLGAGFPLAKSVKPHGRIEASELPGGRTVIAWWLGAPQDLHDVRESLARWMTERRIVPRGGTWEFYWTDEKLDFSVKEWRVQLICPVE